MDFKEVLEHPIVCTIVPNITGEIRTSTVSWFITKGIAISRIPFDTLTPPLSVIVEKLIVVLDIKLMWGWTFTQK